MATEHEGEADCVRDSDCIDPHYSPLYLPWLQLWKLKNNYIILEGECLLLDLCGNTFK